MENIEQQSKRRNNVHLSKPILDEEVGSREYFISLLPSLPASFISKIEHPDFKTLSHDIHFPFHVTLYYLGKLSSDELKLIMDWINKKKALQFPIRARVNSVSSFKKSGEDSVYFLDLSSKEIDELNSELFKRFSHLRKDKFAFKAHMTLFYTTSRITESQRVNLSSLFSDVSEIHFRQLALGSLLDGEIEINHLASLT